MKCIVTGGAGFIGSNLVQYLVHERQYEVLTIDKLTYAGHLESLTSVLEHQKHHFAKIDITNAKDVAECIHNFQPDIIFHLAAESHVDRSIDNAFTFVNTNILGTQILIDIALEYWKSKKSSHFKYIQISTDEVFGALGKDGKFTEQSPYDPNSPYSASKAGAELLVKAYYRTHGLPIIIANCSNNYGPYQYPEKLIPLCILNAVEQKPIPVYGDGKQVRDWLHVTDHVMALDRIAQTGQIGETYCIGGNNEFTNIEVVTTICKHLDKILPRKNKQPYSNLITYVTDRPGHDQRYAIDANKISTQLNWQPQIQFSQGIKGTIDWYLDNKEWVNAVSSSQNARIRHGLQEHKLIVNQK
jgi:dTDP-glucose 4,6-dehydratase